MSEKIAEINLEVGMPSVETAMQKMTNALTTAKKEGKKSILVIHGYGSSGKGGEIKKAVLKRLKDDDGSLRGIVRDYTCGDEWFLNRRQMLDVCGELKNREHDINANPGMTVVLLKK